MDKVTIETMQTFGTVYDAIKWAGLQYGEYPKQPKRPLPLKTNSTSVDAKKYAEELEEFEKLEEGYKKSKEEYASHVQGVNNVIRDYIKHESGLGLIVPAKYQEKVYSKAWEDGHSSGYYEVYNRLCSLVEIFN